MSPVRMDSVAPPDGLVQVVSLLMLQFCHFRAITFDCYGTLIDWETGLLRAFRDLGVSRSIDDDTVLEAFAAAEAAAESPSRGFMLYRDVLRAVLERIGPGLGAELLTAHPYALADSVRDWPAFEDTAGSLAALRERFRIAVVSNVDRDLFDGSRPSLGVAPDVVVTAEDVRSYKPAPGHFRRVLDVLALPASSVLHVAQSLYHDIGPAKELGFATVWVNRRAGKVGHGATAPSEARPDLTVPDLRSLTRLIEDASGGPARG